MPDSNSEVTALLLAWSEGDEAALGKLLPVVMEELKKIAQRYLNKEGREHTLQPTALVNELYLKLKDRRTVQWKNRAQFFGVAAGMMRQILVDHARGRQAAKRGQGVPRVPLDESLGLAHLRPEDLVALDDALKDLAATDPQGAKVVELRFFAGLSYAEIGEVLGCSETTVKREWRAARLWLLRAMTER